jgi:uncharacterized protein YhfF
MAVSDQAARYLEFWRSAREAAPDLPADAAYQVWYFGDSETLARKLADLVLHGPKRATAGLLWEAENDPNMMPVVGIYSIVTDYSGAPLLIIQTTHVEIRPFAEVDADFAAAEGEGDRSLDYWRTAHWNYFARRCAQIGRAASQDMPVVLERFALVYPVAERSRVS